MTLQVEVASKDEIESGTKKGKEMKEEAKEEEERGDGQRWHPLFSRRLRR